MLFTAQHEDALAPTTPDEFAQQNAGLDGLAQADGIRHQDALPRLLQSLEGGVELIRHRIYRTSVTNVKLAIGGRRLTQKTLDVEK